MKPQKTKITKESDEVSKVEHRHGNSVTSLEYAHVNKSIIIYATTHERKAFINMLSRSKRPKAQQVEGFTHMRITSNYFSHHQNGKLGLCLFKFFCKSFPFCKAVVLNLFYAISHFATPNLNIPPHPCNEFWHLVVNTIANCHSSTQHSRSP